MNFLQKTLALSAAAVGVAFVATHIYTCSKITDQRNEKIKEYIKKQYDFDIVRQVKFIAGGISTSSFIHISMDVDLLTVSIDEVGLFKTLTEEQSKKVEDLKSDLINQVTKHIASAPLKERHQRARRFRQRTTIEMKDGNVYSIKLG